MCDGFVLLQYLQIQSPANCFDETFSVLARRKQPSGFPIPRPGPQGCSLPLCLAVLVHPEEAMTSVHDFQTWASMSHLHLGIQRGKYAQITGHYWKNSQASKHLHNLFLHSVPLDFSNGIITYWLQVFPNGHHHTETLHFAVTLLLPLHFTQCN